MEALNYRKQVKDSGLDAEPTDFHYEQIKPEEMTELPSRPGLNSSGKVIQVRVNQYKVSGWPTKDIYQYDVSFDSPSVSPASH